MPDVDLPSLKEQLWQKMQGDLAKFIPDVVERNRLMCCACGRFLPPEHFDVDHMISQRAIKCDPEEVRKNPDTPTNVRAGTILLCTKPLHYRGARFYNNGCNSWKGKNFDGPMTQIFTGRVGQHRNKHGQNALIIGGLALAYLAMVAEFGYVVALMQAAWLYESSSSIPQDSQTGWELSSKQSLWALRTRTPMTRFGRTPFALKSRISRVSLLFETSLSFFPCRVTRETPSLVI